MRLDYKNTNTLLESETDADSFTKKRYLHLFSHLKNFKKILDVGCGTGKGGVILKNLNPSLEIDGVEIVDDFIKEIPNNTYNNIYNLEEIELKVSDNSYDAVIAGEFIEHLYENDFQKALIEFFRIIKIGGRLILTTPNPNYFRLKLNNKSVLSRSHLSQHFPKILKLKLLMNGFNNISYEGSGKVSNFLGKKFPPFFYGSYLIKGDKI